MKLEQQVCSLDLAERLKKLGVKQESYFYWQNDDEGALFVGHLFSRVSEENTVLWQAVSAFTVADRPGLLASQPVNTGARDDAEHFLHD